MQSKTSKGHEVADAPPERRVRAEDAAHDGSGHCERRGEEDLEREAARHRDRALVLAAGR